MAIAIEGRPPARNDKSESVEKLIRDLEELCARGREGDRLPTRAQLMDAYAASERTVLRALDALERSNRIVRKQGWGVFISGQGEVGEKATVNGMERPIVPARMRVTPLVRSGTVGVTAFLDETTLGTDQYLPATLATLRAIENESLALGMKPHFLNRWRKGAPELSPAHCVRELLSQGVDSVIVVDIYAHPSVLADLTSLRELSELPVVYVSSVDHYVPCAHVCFDNRDSGYRATEALLSAGHRHITFLSPYHGRWVDQRVEGARIACGRPGLETPFRVFPMEGQVEANSPAARERATEVVRQFLESGQELGGIVAAHDRVAVDLIQEAGRRGLVAGRDFGVVGFDDEPLSFPLGLTTIRPPVEAMGAEAVRVAAACLSEGSWNRNVSLRADVVVRGTHAAPAS